MLKSIIGAVVIFIVGIYLFVDLMIVFAALFALFHTAKVIIYRISCKRTKQCAIAANKNPAKAMAYWSALILILLINQFAISVANTRAESIILSCERYRQEHGKYPEKLNDIVPEFIDHIPAARYTFTSNKFYYKFSNGKHVLRYMKVPPRLFRYYYFEDNRWDENDF